MLFWLGMTLCVAAVTSAAYFLSDKPAFRRAMRKAPAVPIGTATEGAPIKIAGVATAIGEPLLAPISRRPCVLYRVVVTDKDKPFVKVVEEQRGVAFAVADDTGRAVIDPDAAVVALDVDVTTRSGLLDQANDDERALLRRYNERSRGSVLNRRLTYREAIVAVGERVTVYGEGVREPDPDARPDADYRGQPPTRLRLTSSKKHPLWITDDRAASAVSRSEPG